MNKPDSSTPASASTRGSDADAYLSVTGKRQGPLKGEALAPGHDGDIAVLAWRWGMAAAAAQGATKAAGRRIFGALHVDKLVDASSTKLLSAMASNEELRAVRLGLRKAGADEDFFTVELERARVSSVDLLSDADGGLFESVKFGFHKIVVTYHAQQVNGRRGAAMVFSDELQDGDS